MLSTPGPPPAPLLRAVDGPAGVRLALGQPAVAAYVAVFAAYTDVDRVFVWAEVFQAADYLGVHPGEASWAQLVLGAVEVDLHLALVDEVELLLLVVVVPAGLVVGRHHDCVDPEGGDSQLLADLAEAPTLAEVVEVGDRV